MKEKLEKLVKKFQHAIEHAAGSPRLKAHLESMKAEAQALLDDLVEDFSSGLAEDLTLNQDDPANADTANLDSENPPQGGSGVPVGTKKKGK